MPRLVAAFLIVTLSSIALPGPERLRRRVPDPARRVPLASAVRRVRRDRRDPVGGLHALDVPARELRRGHQRRRTARLPDLTPREWAMMVPTVAMADPDGRAARTCSCGRWSRRSMRAVDRITGAQPCAAPARRRPSGPASRAATRRDRAAPIPESRTRCSRAMNASHADHPDPDRRRCRRIAAMLAEAFRQPGERMPIAGLGLIGLVGAAVASVLPVGHATRSSFGVVRADNFALFINIDPLHRRHPDDAVLGTTSSSARTCRPASTTR